MEIGKTHSSSEEEAHRPTKQLKIGNALSRGPEMGEVQQSEPRAWLPAPMLGGEPLTDDASIRDYNGGHWLPCGFDVGRNPPAPQRHGRTTRIKEERNLSPSQAMFRNGMFCYFFNPFFFLLGITLIPCYLCVYSLLLLYIYILFIYIYIYIFCCVCFVVVFFFKKNRLFKVRSG